MKLKKIVKHITDFAYVELIEVIHNEDFTHWKGRMLDLQTAADAKKDKKQYLKRLEKDNEIETIAKVITAERYMDYYLDTDNEGEAIGITVKKNSHGVDIPHLTIYIKEKK